MEKLKNKDLNLIWHPCSQMKEYIDNALPLIPIKRAKGIYLYDFNEKSYIDCISSWWVNIFGHSNEYINNQLKKQLDSIDHILLAGFTHEGIINLSERLINLINAPFKNTKEILLSKCFYADNGSSAIEVALKLSFHNSLKSAFIKLENAYHGETIGALSMCDVGIYGDIYKPLLIKTYTLKIEKENNIINIQATLYNLKTLLENGDIAAFIVEPLLQCAGGMNILPKEFIKEAVLLVKSYGVYVIFDEIATGFGRTGEIFATFECEVLPDFLCLSKGITGGYLPLSVVITHEEIFKNFLGDRKKAFLHSHSYTGNALACSCANAVLDIFEQDDTINKNREKAKFITELWNQLRDFEEAINIRNKGMVFAFDLKTQNGITFFNKAINKGLILRPLGNTIYFMPPYIINENEIKFVINEIINILKELRYKY